MMSVVLTKDIWEYILGIVILDIYKTYYSQFIESIDIAKFTFHRNRYYCMSNKLCELSSTCKLFRKILKQNSINKHFDNYSLKESFFKQKKKLIVCMKK